MTDAPRTWLRSKAANLPCRGEERGRAGQKGNMQGGVNACGARGKGIKRRDDGILQPCKHAIITMMNPSAVGRRRSDNRPSLPAEQTDSYLS